MAARFKPIDICLYRERCGSCSWWDQIGPAIGFCRVNPPVVVTAARHVGAVGASEISTAWPTTVPKDYCKAWEGPRGGYWETDS